MICDVVILVFMIFTMFFGWKKGFVRSAYSIISIAICLLALYFFRTPVAQYLADTRWGTKLGEFITASYIGFAAKECTKAILTVLSVAIVYFSTKIILQFVFKILDSVTSLPLLHAFNQILGLLVNGVVGAVWIVILVNLFYVLPQTQSIILESKIVEELGMILIS